MERIKLLTYAVVALLVLNFGLLAFLFMGRHNRHNGPAHRPQPREVIIEKLHFDEAQQASYKKLIHWHRSRIDSIDSNIRAAKNKFYSQLVQSAVNVKAKDSLINVLADLQKQIEATHFKHFQDIKSICRKEQLNDFSNLTEELSRIFSKPPKPRND